MDRFAEIVEEKSGGQISVKRFPGGTLGGDVQTLSGLQGGTVEMTTMNAGMTAGVPPPAIMRRATASASEIR